MSRHLTIATRDGLALDAYAQGPADAPPLILLHGLADSRLSFDPLLRLLPDQMHVIALSQRGHGASSRPDNSAAYSRAAFADDAVAALDAAGHQTGSILGHSLGAWAAMHAVERHPLRISSIVLIGAFAAPAGNAALNELSADIAGLSDPVDEEFVLSFQRTASADDLKPAFFDMIVAEALRLPAQVWNYALAAVLRDEVPVRPGAISPPAYLIWGDRDPFVPRADQDALLDALPTSTLQIVEGLGQAPHWDRPELVAQIVAQFLQCQTQSV